MPSPASGRGDCPLPARRCDAQLRQHARHALRLDVAALERLAEHLDLFLRLARRGPPAYIDEPLACFRWYDTSKSGANFKRQLDQASTIAARYGGGRGWLGVRTAAKRLAILGTYRLMQLAAGRRWLVTPAGASR